MSATADQLRLLEITIKEEQFFLTRQKEEVYAILQYYSIIISGVLYGHAHKYSQVGLITGLIASCVICFLGVKQVRRISQRFLETITIRAKIEHTLNFHVEPSKDKVQEGHEYLWVATEPLLNSRYVSARYGRATRGESSAEWVQRLLEHDSYNLAVCKLLYGCSFMSFLLMIQIVYSAEFEMDKYLSHVIKSSPFFCFFILLFTYALLWWGI
jgi:hypothetical protein